MNGRVDEVINKEKGCGIKKCPKCKAVKISRNIERGVFIYWCSRCTLPFEGETIIDMGEFSRDSRYNDYE
jgi:hypothetical protein